MQWSIFQNIGKCIFNRRVSQRISPLWGRRAEWWMNEWSERKFIMMNGWTQDEEWWLIMECFCAHVWVQIERETEEEGGYLVHRRQTFMDQESRSRLIEEPEPGPCFPKFTGWTQLFILMTGAACPRCQNFPFAQKSPKRPHSRLSDRCWWWRLHLPFISEANTCSEWFQGLAPSARRYCGAPRPHALFQSHLLLLHPPPCGSHISAKEKLFYRVFYLKLIQKDTISRWGTSPIIFTGRAHHRELSDPVPLCIAFQAHTHTQWLTLVTSLSVFNPLYS